MSITSQDEHAYLLKRSADHRLLAERAELASSRLAHRSFAIAYAERAAAILVNQD